MYIYINKITLHFYNHIALQVLMVLLRAGKKKERSTLSVHLGPCALITSRRALRSFRSRAHACAHLKDKAHLHVQCQMGFILFKAGCADFVIPNDFSITLPTLVKIPFVFAAMTSNRHLEKHLSVSRGA